MAYYPNNANGQATMANSAPVTIASDQSTLNVSLVSTATGGDTVFQLVSAASNNAQVIKASSAEVTGWYIYNSNANARKVVLYNTSSTPTPGTTTPVVTLMIPGLAAANVALPAGIAFSTGLAIATVTGLANSDNTAVALNDLVINIIYK